MPDMGDQSSSDPIREACVLVVDDHRINREFLSTGLSRIFARVAVAADGPEAIERCRQEDFDVVLMDLHMPRMDGLTAAHSIRDLDNRSARAQMIALTADARPEERTRLLEAGFDEYLNKPIDLPTLVDAIRALLDPRASRRIERGETIAPSRLVDQERALAAANGDRALAERLQGMLARELEDKLPQLDRMIAAGEHDRAAELLHQWAGAGGYAGARRMTHASRMLRRLLLEGRDGALGGAYLHFLRTAHATRQTLGRS